MTIDAQRLIVLATCLCLGACSTAPSPSSKDSKPTDDAMHRVDEKVFGDDPVGVAAQWTDELPDSLPNEGCDGCLEVLRPLSEAQVVRVVRLKSGRYRAVVANDVGSGRDAVLLTIQRAAEGWRVDSVETGSSTAYWPSL